MSDEEHPSDDSGFDADALAALARPSGAPPAMDDDGDAGVLDLRALAASAAPPPLEDDVPEDEADEVASVAAGSAAASAEASKQPAAAVAARPAPEAKGGSGLLIGLGIGLAAAAAVFFLTRGSGTQEPTASAANAPSATAPLGAGAVGAAAPTPTQQAATTPGPRTGDAPPTTAGDPAAEDAPGPERMGDPAADDQPTTDAAPARVEASGRPSHRPTRHVASPAARMGNGTSGVHHSGNAEPARAAEPPASTSMATSMATTMQAETGSDRSMDALLNSALGGEPSRDGTMTEESGGMTAMSAAPSNADLPESPSRSVVTRVLGGLMSQIRRCAGDQVGMANARIRITSDGSVASVAISGSPFGGTPQGSCMERVVRRARFPRFRRSNIDLTFPFSIRPLN